MKSLTRPSFWRSHKTLDPRIGEAARRAYAIFAENPDHPIVWVWIGSHNDFDNLFG